MMLRSALMLPVLLAATPLPAQPAAGADPRYKTFLYTPEQIFTVQSVTGFQVTIQFSPDEIIENVAVGDSGAWQVTPNRRADHLFVKPVQPGIETNMTVLTSVRLYSFDLKPYSGPVGQMPYLVRFTYPDEKPQADPGPDGANAGRYKLSGAQALRPSAISDDGRHTYIQWPRDRDLPAVYAIGTDGKEALVNGMMRDEIFVIDSVEPRLVFRIDKQVARAERVAGNPK